MSNLSLYEIKEEYKELLSNAEEELANDGIVSPETEKALMINQEQLLEKAENYTNLLEILDSRMHMADRQLEKVKDFKDRQTTLANKLKYNMLQALLTYGDEDKNGVRRLEFATTKLSTRKAKFVDIEDENLIPDQHKTVEVKMSLERWNAIKKILLEKGGASLLSDIFTGKLHYTEKIAVNKTSIKGTIGDTPGASVEDRIHLVIK